MSRPKPASAKPDRVPVPVALDEIFHRIVELEDKVKSKSETGGCAVASAPESELTKLARLIDQAKSADSYLVSHIANLEAQLTIAKSQLADVRLSHAGLLRSQDAYSALAKH